MDVGAAGSSSLSSLSSGTGDGSDEGACVNLSASLSDFFDASISLPSQGSGRNDAVQDGGLLISGSLFEQCFSSSGLLNTGNSTVVRELPSSGGVYGKLACAPILA